MGALRPVAAPVMADDGAWRAGIRSQLEGCP